MQSRTINYPHGLSRVNSASFTLIDLLRTRAVAQPEKLAYTFLSEGDGSEISLTYGQLDRKARSIAAILQNLGLSGRNALLLYPPGLEFNAGFFGCLYAGVVAVPAHPARNSRGLPRLQAIIKDSQAAIVLTTSHISSMAKLFFAQAPDLEALNWLATDEVDSESDSDWRQPTASGDALAFLQYTSGSTGKPKGVMLSHRNLLHNASAVFNAVEHTAEDKYVSWLPTFHDMGFMAGVLQPLYAGIPAILMSPASFLQSPVQWLQAISNYGGTTSGGPNFAYDLCVRKTTPEQRARLDLSSWSVAFNGAEPIRAKTIAQFVEAFGPCGFRPEAFFPCYGLAEATLIVSGPPKIATPIIKTFHSKALQSDKVIEAPLDGEDAQSFVGCGSVIGSQQVAIVDTESFARCSAGQVGEIWVAGPSVAQGYWNQAEETEQTFRAFIHNTGEGPFLRTGDLGFMQGGELFITGRSKDLIIIRGSNHYPQDIELSVEQCLPALRPGCGAAFSIDIAGEERLVVVQEIDLHNQSDDIDTIIGIVRQKVAQNHELQLHALALIRSGTIPKTSSGKIQRNTCKRLFLEKALVTVAEWEGNVATETEGVDSQSQDLPLTDGGIQPWLLSQLASKLNIDVSEIDINRPVAQYGVDSLIDIELVHSVNATFGVALPAMSFLQDFSVAELALQIQQRMAEPQAFSTLALTAAEAQSEYPLSYGQQAIWFLHQLAPESSAYNIAGAARLSGKVNVEALRRSFQTLSDRHPSLRTTFKDSNGKPVQQVHERLEINFHTKDASTWDDETLDDRLVEEAHKPFDLENSPALRVSIFSTSNQDYVLLLVVHHIVADLWSLSVLLSELGALYQAEISGTQAKLPALELHYKDYVRWQAELLASPRGEQVWEDWQKQLSGDLPALSLATDRPRPPVQTYNGASVPFNLSADVTEKLKALARAHRATLYTTLLAAFQVLLYRYSGQEEILVGSPTAGRARPEFGNIIGYFVNPVVVRANLSADPTFGAFLDDLLKVVLSAVEHQDYPLPLLVEKLQPERDPSRSPLFQVMFALQKAPHGDLKGLGAFALGEAGAKIKLGELEMESLAIKQRAAQFDLSLMMAEADEGLIGSLQYNTDLFDESTISRMAQHLHILLAGITADPERRLSELPILSPAERHQLLVQWNETQADYPSDRCIHHLFEAQVERDPDAIALIFQQEQLTYRELNQRSNQLARYLRSLGARPETRVGICLERSAEMVVAMLAVLKAGATYVPLDPTYPAERVMFMLEDSAVLALLTQERLLDSLPGQGLRIICVDADSKTIELEDDQDLDGGATPDNLAYVIYTSGSTGKPKGVAIEHHSTVAMLDWARQYFTPEERSSILASTSICFDLSLFELFVPLSWGGKVILAGNVLELSHLPANCEISLVNTVPSAMAHLIQEGAVPPSVKTVNLAGEALHNALVQQVYHQETIERVFNLYGPSEDTTYSTAALIKKGAAQAPPIGRPISNTQIYLLDGRLHPVVMGGIGELYISGVGLARGYLNRPDLTAERFLPDPFSPRPGARLYKTGDLARYLADGNLEYMGRSDYQIKVRGFRIELGEIETELGRHEGVRQCVVVVREDEPGDKRLVAYVVAADGVAITAQHLHGFLKQRLPDYMVPSAFAMLDSMPLTPNGKINRQALPVPDRSSLASEAAYEAARNPIEEVVANTWEQVLAAGKVGIADNFFEMGGSSLVATQVISRLQKIFKVDLPLRTIFEYPTVEALADKIEFLLGAQTYTTDSPITQAPRGEGLPLSFAQQRLWFIDRFEPGSYSYNMPGALKLKGRLDTAALKQSLNELVRRHESLRTTFGVIEGRPIQIIAPDFTLELAVTDISHLSDGERDIYILEAGDREAKTPFDLAKGPLLRTSLARLDEQTHVLFVTMHHIISDGWSLNIFLKELLALYEAFSNNQPSPLADLPIQYADFAVWQRQWLEGEALDTLLPYWKKQLGGDLPVLELPTDKPRPAVANLDGAKQTITIPKRLSEDLKSFSVREGATLFMTLLAAFKVLLYRYSGQDDIVIGTPIANRTRPEIEDIIGFFVNALVLRTDLRGRPSFRALLGRVRETTIDAYTHQSLPFEKLVEELQPERDLRRSPLFQVMMDLQGAPLPEFEIPGLSVSVLETGGITTKQIDLTLFVVDSDEGLITSLEYSTDLFEPSTITRMLGQFQTVLQSAIDSPDERISELTLLTEAERHQILVEWNQTQADYPLETCVHEIIEAAAEEVPNNTAIISEQGQLTFQELNSRANQLAHYLRKQNVGVETLVGISMEHSAELVVAMIGVMKAGGAYLALDPDYPSQRLASMLEDTHAPILLTQERLLTHLPETTARIICVDRQWPEIAQESDSNLHIDVTADNLAIVLYTSGSTGKPKGVMMTHRNTCNHIFWVQRDFPMNASDRMPFKYSICFDASAFEVLYPIYARAQMVIVPQPIHQDVAAMVKFIRKHNITVLDVPTPLLPVLLEDAEFLKSQSLRHVFAGSDSMTVELKERFFELIGKPLVHFYGPCEASIGSNFNVCRPGDDLSIVSVGIPVSNTQIYVLDRNMQPVSAGMVGEIYVGGVGVVRGYLNRPDVTAEKFVPDLFSKEPGARMYRTGDRGRFRPDGKLQFAGRVDEQVKVRGYRIELGDVETAILEYPPVKEVIVVARQIDNGQPGAAAGPKRLVAYVAFNNGDLGQAAELRRFVAKKLPDYMVPSEFITLGELPRGSGGKVDLLALPTHADGAFEPEPDFVSPRNAVEEAMSMIWSEVLGVASISVHSNFFELGGHSLAAAQIIYRVRDLFQVELPLRSLFEGPTLAELSQALISSEAKPGRTEKIAQAYKKIKNMSVDDKEKALQGRKRAKP